jgi:Zn-dependent oligopeptidase
MDRFVNDPELLLNELDRLEATSFYVSNVATLYLTLQQTPDWQKACFCVHGMLSERPYLESVRIRKALQRIQEEEQAHSLSDLSRWLVQYHLSSVSSHARYDEVENSSLQQLDAALRRLESEVISQTRKPVDPTVSKQTSPSETKAQLELIHTYIALQHQRAEVMGHKHHAESVFSSKQVSRLATSTADVASLHCEIADRATKLIQLTPVKEWQEATEGAMADTSDYLTLDGVLGGIMGLSRALFGIKIQEEQEFTQGWHNDVRLFHIYSEDDKYMASFYLDPYSGPIKMLRPFMNPLWGNRSAYMSCRIRAPMWDHLPTPLQIEDAANLLHEFGHVLQFLLAETENKTALGAQNLPLDVSEVMPQFMEHWLFEKSVLQSFAHLSQSTIPDELIEKLQKQRSLRKATDLLRHVFLSQLELDMFSNGKQEDESLVAFQRRVALGFVPHELPARSDLTPMVEIIENNAKGKRIAQYRYVYGEVLSAQLFAKLQEADIKDQTKVQELGAKLRTCLLKPGASVDTKTAFESLLGSSSISPEAMFKLYNF